jgi:hypothetical protein
MIAFCNYHIASLTLLLEGQTSHPSPEEAEAIFRLWTDYQATLLQSSNAISASADALTVNPRAPPRRRHTFPMTRDETQNSDRSEGVSQPFVYSLKNLTVKIVKPLRNLGRYIRTKLVRNEPSACT